MWLGFSGYLALELVAFATLQTVAGAFAAALLPGLLWRAASVTRRACCTPGGTPSRREQESRAKEQQQQQQAQSTTSSSKLGLGRTAHPQVEVSV